MIGQHLYRDKQIDLELPPRDLKSIVNLLSRDIHCKTFGNILKKRSIWKHIEQISLDLLCTDRPTERPINLPTGAKHIVPFFTLTKIRFCWNKLRNPDPKNSFLIRRYPTAECLDEFEPFLITNTLCNILLKT